MDDSTNPILALMPTSQKVFLTIAFMAVLVGLGVTDAMLTGGTLRIPGRGADEGVTKNSGPAVLAIVHEQGFDDAASSEKNLLESVIPPGTALSSHALLKDNDRVATLAWIDLPDVKEIFTALRRHLRSSFSPAVKDLIDETQAEPGKPPRDMLSFYDPKLHPDRLVFVRVRQRVYEFHVTVGKEAEVNRLVDALTE